MRRPSLSSTPPAAPGLAPRHRHAIRAALLEGRDGEAAYAAWRRLVPLNDVDGDEFRILPLIYLRAQERGSTAPEMGRLKGVYRQVWVRNRLLLQDCTAAVQVLAAGGVPSVLLKGMAMFVRWAGALGPRAMRDIDILVPRADARHAARLLAGAGWGSTTLPTVSACTGPDLDWWPGAPLSRDDGREIDLHWRALPRNTSPDHDAAFWAGSAPIEILGTRTRVLRPEDQLYHTLLHGARWTDGAGLDWLVDVQAILRSHPDGIDWDRVAGHAFRDRSVPAIAGRLQVLREVVGVETPLGALLARGRPSPLDRAVARSYRQPYFYPRRGEITLVNYHASLVRDGRRAGLASWLAFVREQWRLERASDVVPEACFRLLGRPFAARAALCRAGHAAVPAPHALPPLGSVSAPAADPERSPFVFGWSGPEPGWRWTEGPDAILAFRDDAGTHGALSVTVTATPFLGSQRGRLRVEVLANDVRCATWRFAQGDAGRPSQLRVTVPEAARKRRPGMLVLVLSIHHPARPIDTGESRDRRRLGLCVRQIEIGPKEPAAAAPEVLPGAAAAAS